MSLSVGSEVLSFCGSCKMDLTHTIIAMTKEKIKKCQCRTCKALHGFKEPKGITDPNQYKEAVNKSVASGKKKGRTRTVKEIITHDVLWEKVMAEHKNSPSLPYSTKTPFKTGTIISHPTFGDGLIEKLIHPNKIEVVFKMETKVLIHAGVSTPISSAKPPPSKLFNE